MRVFYTLKATEIYAKKIYNNEALTAEDKEATIVSMTQDSGYVNVIVYVRYDFPRDKTFANLKALVAFLLKTQKENK